MQIGFGGCKDAVEPAVASTGNRPVLGKAGMESTLMRNASKNQTPAFVCRFRGKQKTLNKRENLTKKKKKDEGNVKAYDLGSDSEGRSPSLAPSRKIRSIILRLRQICDFSRAAAISGE